MDFIYLICNGTKKPLAIALSGARTGLRGRDDGGDLRMYNISLIRIVTMNPALYNEYILIKFFI
jgi:hypothetical protein